MIEGQTGTRGQGDPLGKRCVIASARRAVRSPDSEDDRHRVLPRVPLRVGPNADQGGDPAPEPGLLPELSQDRLFHRLADLDEPARQGPFSPEGRVSATDQKDSSPTDPDGIDRERGTRVPTGHAPASAGRGISATLVAAGKGAPPLGKD